MAQEEASAAGGLLKALESGDLERVRRAIAGDPGAARQPRVINEAAGHVFQPAMAILVKHGADLNAAWRGYRPLQNLIQSGHHGGGKPLATRLRCLAWMLAHGADPEQTGAWPPARAVIVAAFGGHAEYIPHLRRPDDAFAAAALGDGRQVRRMVKKRSEFVRERDTGGLTALQCAAGSRIPGPLVEIARVLLDAGADPGAKTKSWGDDIDAVHLAASAKNAAMFELLLDRGANPSQALSSALWNDREDMARIALARGAKPDHATLEGRPLLNNLIRWGAFQGAVWLLGQGASPNVADARGWTAVHQAASRGNEKMLRALLDAGGDIARRDNDGCVPRDRASRDKILAMLGRKP